ncbi:MAG: hypothetical protein JWM63_2511 [Gammaproteobacteria bacterium]|nr:hypothetical protein [Gammaproteobacteria bacterium]
MPDVVSGGGERLQPLARNRISTLQADSVAACLDPPQRRLNFAELIHVAFKLGIVQIAHEVGEGRVLHVRSFARHLGKPFIRGPLAPLENLAAQLRFALV